MAGDRIRLGFIGTGNNARWHMSTVLGIPEFEVVGMADINPDQMAASKRQHPALASVPEFDDYHKMLDAVDLDAVEISTPHTTHHDQVVTSLGHGLHVLCEKPLVCSVADAHDAIAKLEQSGKVGILSYQRHFQGEFRIIRDILARGDMGEVQFVNALQSQNWKRGVAGTWRHDPALSGGGQLNDSGSHLLDIILWITGLSVEKVSAFIDNRGIPVDINSAISVVFKGGAQGNISVIGDGADWHEDVSIWCEHGMLLMRNGRLQIVDRGNRSVYESVPPGISPDRNFADAILGRAQVESPFTCGLRVIELTEAAWRSAAAGGAVVTV